MALTKVTSGLISADASSVDLNIDAGTLYIDSTNNRVGIGNTSPSDMLHVAGAEPYIRVEDTTNNAYSRILFGIAGNLEFDINPDSTGTSGRAVFKVDGSEAMRIDSSGNVGIGNTNPTSPNGFDKFLHIGSASNSYTSIVMEDDNNTWELCSNNTFTIRDGTSTRMTIDLSGNLLVGTDSGDAFNTYSIIRGQKSGSASYIQMKVDPTNQTGILFGDTDDDFAGGMIYENNGDYLKFHSGNAECMRIDSGGALLIGKTSQSLATAGTELLGGLVRITRSGNHTVEINRLSSDGNLVLFYQGTTQEGSISVSGTTVSYNGGHLSRWSQLSDNTKDETIVKGTVMTNLNQMAEWTTDGVTEANEQLNCMAVSSVEGDVNVAGVFVNWDEDDEVYTADMNVAMTGDMVIRIAQGVTVAQGDLLMSAGDGTAKPQDDDIIRAKTIAKVTSTHVSHTYDDGSYLVPCVLMAC